MPLVTLTCEVCSKSFSVKQYRAKTAKTCSKACQGVTKRVEHTLEEKQAKIRQYNQTAKEKKIATQGIDAVRKEYRDWYYAHHEERLKSNSIQRDLHREERQAQQRAHKKEWYKENIGKALKKNHDYYLNNTESVKKTNAAYQRNNPEKVNAFQQRRRAKKLATVNDFTADQWEEILHIFHHRCAYCQIRSKDLEIEHITPLSKGGQHTASNIVPACRTCNRQKHAGPVLSPVQPLLLTIAQAKPARKRKKLL